MPVNRITAAGIVQALTNAELVAVAREAQEWHRTGVTDGTHLADLSSDLVNDAGISKEGIMQVAEGLVLREVCNRWIVQQGT